MTNKIVIEGNMVRLIQETVTSESTLEALAPHLVTRLPTILPVLPTAGATRYVGFNPATSRGLMIVEVQPRTHTLSVFHHPPENSLYADDAARRDNSGMANFRVTFPFTYFVFVFSISEREGALARFSISNSALLWRKETYREATDRFHIAACPNVDTYGSICWGSTINPQNSFSAHVDAMINEFFTSKFNQDLGHRTPFETSLTDWEEDSREPLNYLKWDLWSEDENETISVENMWERWSVGGVPEINMAELNPAYVEIPELPRDFTVLRAREWYNSLPEATQRRLAVAINVQEEVPV